MPTDPLAQPDEPTGGIPPSSLPPLSTPPLGSATSIPLTPVEGSTSTGLEPNIAAGLSTVVTFITGIIFLVLEKRNAYVRFWAMQSTVFGVAWFAVAIVFGVIHVVLHSIFWPLAILWGIFSAVVQLVFLIGWIVMMIQAFTGKEWEFPFLGKIARQQLARSSSLGL